QMLHDPSPYQSDLFVDTVGPMTRKRTSKLKADLANFVQRCATEAQLISSSMNSMTKKESLQELPYSPSRWKW
ncbi:hypothetical protein, partial [Salmonella enterica]|uniref:hypothetical protein n=1 Tax=Salmonella enterica TaxID=28901 RepID=UPI001F355E55